MKGSPPHSRVTRLRDAFRADGEDSRRALFLRVGIHLLEYYWIEEPIPTGPSAQAVDLPPGHTWEFLNATAIPEISAFDAPRHLADPEVVRTAMGRGDLCIGIRDRGQLVAITCCALDATHLWLHPISLAPHEAYIHHVYVRPECRGKRLASLIRELLYPELRARGRDRCYSITLANNHTSIAFKERQGGRKRFRAFGIKVGTFTSAWIVRRYPN